MICYHFILTLDLENMKNYTGGSSFKLMEITRRIIWAIYTEMAPNNVGRIMWYLTLVYKFADSLDEQMTREAARRTVEEFKRIDLAKYQIKSSPYNENRTLLGCLVKSFIFAYLHA